MSFLGRIAARASASSLGAADQGARTFAPEVVPAVTSKSPLVRFDQRLTLPGFAEMAPVSAGVGTVAFEADDGLAAPSAAETPAATRDFNAAASAAALSSSALRRSVAAVDGEGTTRGERAIAPTASLEPVPGAVPSAFAPRDERPVFELETRSPGEVSTSASFPAANARPVAELTPAFDLRTRLEPSTRSDSASDSSPSPLAPENKAPARTVLDAVARLDAWLRTESRDVEPALPAVALPVAASQPFDGTEPAAAPTISIGKLEIEVVAPALEARFRSASPSQEQRHRRPVQSAPRPVPAGGARGFGWRQR